MALKTHTIIQFSTLDQLIFHDERPDWLQTELPAQQFAVVRRMEVTDIVPIGIRGSNRSQRCAAFINRTAIVNTIPCTDLVAKIAVFQNYWYYPYLQKLQESLSEHEWGITGSIGFEIATGMNVTTEQSDIDISIYVDEMNWGILANIYEKIQRIYPRIDVQIEVAQVGCVLLNDFIRNYAQGFLVRTTKGPLLCKLVDEKLQLA